MLKVILMPSNINVNKLAKQVLKNEPKIIKRYPPTALDGKYTDGSTQLGLNSLTSRFSHFNVLKWWGTRSLRKSNPFIPPLTTEISRSFGIAFANVRTSLYNSFLYIKLDLTSQSIIVFNSDNIDENTILSY